MESIIVGGRGRKIKRRGVYKRRVGILENQKQYYFIVNMFFQ